MSNERPEQRFPAVEHLRDALRVNLLRAVRANPGIRARLSRRQRVGVLAAIGLVAVPTGMAVANAIESPEIEYECPNAEPPPDADVSAGVPVDSAAPVVEGPNETSPVSPCE
jgi:hypothetical protein